MHVNTLKAELENCDFQVWNLEPPLLGPSRFSTPSHSFSGVYLAKKEHIASCWFQRFWFILRNPRSRFDPNNLINTGTSTASWWTICWFFQWSPLSNLKSSKSIFLEEKNPKNIPKEATERTPPFFWTPGPGVHSSTYGGSRSGRETLGSWATLGMHGPMESRGRLKWNPGTGLFFCCPEIVVIYVQRIDMYILCIYKYTSICTYKYKYIYLYLRILFSFQDCLKSVKRKKIYRSM